MGNINFPVIIKDGKICVTYTYHPFPSVSLGVQASQGLDCPKYASLGWLRPFNTKVAPRTPTQKTSTKRVAAF